MGATRSTGQNNGIKIGKCFQKALQSLYAAARGADGDDVGMTFHWRSLYG